MSEAEELLNLGERYMEGEEGIAQDEAKAVELFQRAADLGNADAMVRLGECYDDGEGVEQDKSKAVEWYQRAAD